MLLLYVADMMLLCRLMLGSWYSIVGLHQVSEESPCARFKFCIQGCSVICFFGDNLILADYTALPSVALGTSFPQLTTLLGFEQIPCNSCAKDKQFN